MPSITLEMAYHGPPSADFQVSIVHADEKGDPDLATRLVADMIKANVSVIIGPENFCRKEAQLATYFSLPMFSYVSIEPRSLTRNQLTFEAR